MQNIYVGNLSSDTTEKTLRAVFEEFGQVLSVNLMKDRDTGVPRGFAFIEMSSDLNASLAIASVNKAVIDGRCVIVNEARLKVFDVDPMHPFMRRHRQHGQ